MGKPVVVTANEPGFPAMKVAAFALVSAAASKTFKFRLWLVEPAASALSASWIVYWPPVPGAGFPVMPFEVNESPFGNVLARLTVPIFTVTGNEPSDPTKNAALFELVKRGAFTTLIVMDVGMSKEASVAENSANGATPTVKDPEVPIGGVPLNVAVPLFRLLVTKLSHGADWLL